MEEGPRVKRFKHQSYNELLKEVHLPSALEQKQFEHDEVEENGSLFHASLDHWRQLNLAPSFVHFAKNAEPLCLSMPLLLHNWRAVLDLWIGAMDASDDEGYKALLDLLQKLAADLRNTLLPTYKTILSILYSLLPRPISTDALSVLLTTLTSVFKYLLIPSLQSEARLLEETWTDLRSTLVKCLPEVQRAVAEVWGAVLRRLKGKEIREEAIVLLAKSLEDVEDTCAFSLAFACKSVSQTLHTCTPSLIEPLLSYHLNSSTTPERTQTFIRRCLTAFIHHVKSADQFTVVADLLLKHLDVSLELYAQPGSSSHAQSPIVPAERLRRMLEVITVPCSVRQGSRLSHAHLTQLFSSLSSLPLTCNNQELCLHSTLLEFCSSLFIASDMALWLNQGRDFIQRSWESTVVDAQSHSTLDDVMNAETHCSVSASRGDVLLAFTLPLHASLAQLSWGGWKLIALPLVVKHSLHILSIASTESAVPVSTYLIHFLGALRRDQKLSPSDVDIVWKQRLEKLCLETISSLGFGDDTDVTHNENQGIIWHQDAAAVLNDVLALSSFFSPAFPRMLVELINRTLESFPTLSNQPVPNANAAWVIGTCMQSLAGFGASDWSSEVDLTVWILACTKKFPWSADVLDGLVALSRAFPSTPRVLQAEIYPTLQGSLISHSRPLRLATLRLLLSPVVKSSNSFRECLRLCLQGEEAFLSVQGVRERVVRIGRVGQVVVDEESAEVCIRWLISQLKVNLRPVWSPAAAAIASLGSRFDDLVWRMVFEEVKGVALKGKGVEEHGDILPTWADSGPSTDAGEDVKENGGNDVWEEERTWRDPSGRKLRSVVTKWVNQDKFWCSEFIEHLPAQERFDTRSYEAQLLAALGQCSSLAEKHNRELITFFLSLARGDSDPNTLEQSPVVLVPRLIPRDKLIAYLGLFSKLSNPKALYATDTLRALYITLLSHPDRTLQSASLSCLLTYKPSSLHGKEESLKALFDETRWRDELTSFDITSLGETDRAEVVDVLIRLLFGRMLERRGKARGMDRKATVVAALAVCNDMELTLLVELMLKPFGVDVASAAVNEADALEHGVVSLDDVSEKQQTGFLMLLGDVMKNLGTRLIKHWPVMIRVVTHLIANAHQRISGFPSVSSNDDDDQQLKDSESPADDHEDEGDGNEEDGLSSSSKVYRSIRQLGLKRLADFFRAPVSFDFDPFLKASFPLFISPRLASFAIENTQAPSPLLELFYSWTSDARYTRYLIEYDPQTLPNIYDCLLAKSVKPAVVSRIFDIVDRLLTYSAIDDSICEHILKPYASHLLANLSILVERSNNVASISTPLGQRQIGILSSIAQYLVNEEQASTLLRLFIPFLRKPTKTVPERVKVDLIKIICEIMPLISELKDPGSALYEKLYESFSQMFQSLRSRHGRVALVSAFRKLADVCQAPETLPSLMESLNAYSVKRIDEPDFDRRLVAFADLNENTYKTLSAAEWLPVLYNALYFVQDHEELAIRSNSSFTLKRFTDVVASQSSSQHERVFLRVLYPGLKNGLRSKNELVRAEMLGVMAYAVAKCVHIRMLTDMRVLLAGGDEEANFFNNILHVQVHRRSRALRRLGDFCEEGCLRSSTVSDIFVPLVETFILSAAKLDHHLVNDAILATGRMAKCLSWGPYHSLIQKYITLSKAKDESERIYIRTLVSILDNFHFPMEDETAEVEQDQVIGDDVQEDDNDDGKKAGVTLPKTTTKIADAVNLRLLPSLLDHLEKHDSMTDDNARLPISIGIVNVARHMPAATREPQVSRLLTILSQIFRSRSQETRDLTRDALQKIAVILGPNYLSQIIRELRAALTRGPHLHVLASVTHTILVHVTAEKQSGSFENLDNCVNDIAYVSAEVIFGESGKDVQAEGFKTKMREVRSSSSKGFDSFGIAARYVTPSKISSLLTPLRSIMHETESAKVMGLVDEVLKRIASGLNSNKHLVPTELIVLCHTLVSQNSNFLQQAPSQRKQKMKNDAIVQAKRDVTIERNHFTNNSFRFVAFGLDLLHTALRRTRFDFHDTEVMSRLNSMIVAVGNTLYSTSALVVVLGLKCAAGLAKCPLRGLEKSLPVFVAQSLDIIKQAGNTEAEVVQVAFKALATMLRDGPPVQVKEKDLIFLLELLTPDLEEPSRQASVFTMLRAIVARKFVVPEIYDIMQKVSEVMITSQSTQVQELCRGVLLQFLLDYPQGKGRLRTQMAFLAKNLSYVHENGRKSVMELLHAVMSKFNLEVIREYTDLLFVALVMVIANDDSAKCREMAATLIKSLISRLDEDHREIIFLHLHSWASQREQQALMRVSSQVYGFLIEVLQDGVRPYIATILQDSQTALETALQTMDHNSDESMEVDLEWQVPYHSLTVLFKAARALSDFDIAGDQIPWNMVSGYLTFPHAWVRMAASRLLGLLFNAVPVGVPNQNLPDNHPLSGVGIREVADKCCMQLKSEHLDESLSLQVVKNLFYIGKCFYCIPIGAHASNDPIEDESESEKKGSDPLPWLFTKLSYQVRSAYIARRNKSESLQNWHQQPLAILRWFAAMASHMEPFHLENYLAQILSPIYRLTEDDTIQDSSIGEVKTLAIEVQDLVQQKVGVLKFSNVYTRIRQSVENVRRERKVARALQTASNPEAAAKRKLQRNVMKKMSKKRKERGFADIKRARKRTKED
ncbi:hypothetical protein AMATHDRAFT_67804 [Amanita thiersii Skay4041]|uniref:Uncharacterized protein n=1 Tax=Amanita thiersii Skay4041 TaxID=703135 RepID=A0A2A9N9W1_9AGAR|nr:hypothetical protein AMATHDRAFT_67804 [Amanita thiersii Skay4041]